MADPLPDLDTLTDEQAERLDNFLRATQALKEKTPQELVNLALERLSLYVSSPFFELIVEELCTRVYPNWPNEDPSADSGGTDV